jgi:hypothetical protein
VTISQRVPEKGPQRALAKAAKLEAKAAAVWAARAAARSAWNDAYAQAQLALGGGSGGGWCGGWCGVAWTWGFGLAVATPLVCAATLSLFLPAFFLLLLVRSTTVRDAEGKIPNAASQASALRILVSFPSA